MKVLTKKVCEIPGLEDYPYYYITSEGEVYSNKHKKLKKIKQYPSVYKKGRRRSYLTVQLYSIKRKRRSFFVDQLVGRGFLPNPTNSRNLRHKDGDVSNNALSNLEWMGRKKEGEDGTIELDTDRLVLSKEMSDYIKLVHLSALEKNIPVGDTYEFFHKILNESLDEYVNRFGLKKTMFQIQNSSSSSS